MTPYYKFMTKYRKEDRTFGSYVVAPDEEAASKMLTFRNIGEEIESLGMPLTRKLPEAGSEHFPHWLIFIGYIAIQSRWYREDIFSDTGVIHEMLHYHQLRRDNAELAVWLFTEESVAKVKSDYRQLLIQIGFAAPYEEVL